MPTVIHVKKARKDNKAAGIKKGQEYWMWKFKSGGRFGVRYFTKRPTRSQTTQSEFYSEAYALEENLGSLIGYLQGKNAAEMYSNPADVSGEVESLASEVRNLGEMQTDKFDNMPEGLQQGDSGQLLEERASNCETLADDLEAAAQEIESLDTESGHEDGDEGGDWRDEAANILEGVSWDL